MEILRFAQNDGDVGVLSEKRHKAKTSVYFSQLLIFGLQFHHASVSVLETSRVEEIDQEPLLRKP